MKILILTHFLGRGGSSSLAVQVRDRLRHARHQATILATRHTEDCISDDADFLLHKQHLSRRLTVLRLLERIQEIEPDLVYSISGTVEIEVLRFLKIPRVRHFSSLESHKSLDIRHLFQQGVPYFEGVTANTPDVLETLKSWSPQGSYKTGTFPYDLDLPPSENAGRFAPQPIGKPRQICFIGRLENFQKRADWLPEIIARNASSPNPVDWHIYGDGPLSASITSQIAKITPPVKVSFHNWVSQAELVNRIPEHDLFFLCSRWEGLPIAMVEAMLCGVACLVPDTCAGAEYALDCGGGWLYHADSPASCAASLAGILNDSTALDQARQKAADIARKKFIGAVPALQTNECIDMFSSLQFNGRVDTPDRYKPFTPLPSLRNTKRKISVFTSCVINRLSHLYRP